MSWREALYCAFANSFQWKSRRLSPSELNDMHEYAVFLRSRFSLLRIEAQLDELGLVLENLMDTYEWDSRDADAFLEWLNPFNDYLGSQYNILEWAESLAEKLIKGEPVSEEELRDLLGTLNTLPRFPEGRLGLFAHLNDLQRFAVWAWLREFISRYSSKLDWIEQLETTTALLYWDHIATHINVELCKRTCDEYINSSSYTSISWSWDQMRCLAEAPHQAPYFFEWCCSDESPSVSLSRTAEMNPMQQNDLIAQLRALTPTQMNRWSELYGWVSSRGELPDCLCAPGGIRLHSSRLRQTLQDLGLSNSVRYLPVRMIDQSVRREIAVYHAAFFQNRLSCLSRKRTIGIWSHDFARVIDLHRPALVKSCIANAELFVVAEDDTLVVVSERIKDALEKIPIKGCTFKQLLVVDD
ncbi:hypothetical protein HRbin15_02686 [bacterium HR15]|nr:hypothetical protein HRbin15_02686 [bacterium HR15]